MLEQLAPGTLKAKKHTATRIKSIPGAVFFGAADIGQCELEDGRKVYITWGRNLDRASQQQFLNETDAQTVWISADDGCAELVIDDAIAKFYL